MIVGQPFATALVVPGVVRHEMVARAHLDAAHVARCGLGPIIGAVTVAEAEARFRQVFAARLVAVARLVDGVRRRSRLGKICPLLDGDGRWSERSANGNGPVGIEGGTWTMHRWGGDGGACGGFGGGAGGEVAPGRWSHMLPPVRTPPLTVAAQPETQEPEHVCSVLEQSQGCPWL